MKRKVNEMIDQEVQAINDLLDNNCTFDKYTGNFGQFELCSGLEGGYSSIEVEIIVSVFNYMKSIGVSPY